MMKWCFYTHGFWFRWPSGRGWSCAFPWSIPLFSERYGHRKPVFNLLKFRWFRLENN